MATGAKGRGFFHQNRAPVLQRDDLLFPEAADTYSDQVKLLVDLSEFSLDLIHCHVPIHLARIRDLQYRY
jgi:hypothetical protein